MSKFKRFVRDFNIYTLHKSGKSIQEISGIYSLKPTTVDKIIKKRI